MMTTNDDPIAKALDALPDEKVSPRLAEDVRRAAKQTLLAESYWWVRLDRLFMDRLMPAALFVMAAGYSVGFVDFLHRTYPIAEARTTSAAVHRIVDSRRG